MSWEVMDPYQTEGEYLIMSGQLFQMDWSFCNTSLGFLQLAARGRGGEVCTNHSLRSVGRPREAVYAQMQFQDFLADGRE